jgi:hypothetical protein
MALFEIRPAQAGDAPAMAELFASVAAERDGIATEPPVDVAERTAVFARSAGDSIVAVADARVIGMLHVEVSRYGFGELGMLVERGWRRRLAARLARRAGRLTVLDRLADRHRRVRGDRGDRARRRAARHALDGVLDQ